VKFEKFIRGQSPDPGKNGKKAGRKLINCHFREKSGGDRALIEVCIM